MTLASTLIAPIAAAALALSGTAFAQDHHGMDHSGHDHAHEGEVAPAADAVLPTGAARTITVRVNGMVCDFCARSLTKVLQRDENVEAVAISLEDKTVTIALTEDGRMDDEAVTDAVLSAGYNVASIERSAS